MPKSRISTLVSLILLGFALLIMAIPGLWIYASATAPKLHRVPREIPSVTNSPPSSKWAAAVEQGREIVQASLSEQNLPGLSVAVGINGDIVWAEGFGFANLEPNIPVTPDHRFRMGSASKLFTAAGIALLLEQGKLSLDEPIQTYAPEFPKKQWPLTIRQIMANIGGLRIEDTDNGVLTSSYCGHASDAVKLFAKDPLVFQPGAQYADSTFGWVLLSSALETAAKKPVTAFLMDNVIAPLDLRDTLRESGKGPVPGEATAYSPRFFSDPRYGASPIPRFDYSCYAGANGFLSTPSDLVRFAMAINSGKLLKPETVQLLQTPQRLTAGKETGAGLGWDVKTMTVAGQPTRAVGSNGDFWNGTVASLLTFPDRGIAVAVMSNITQADTPSLAEKIAQAFAQRR